MKELGTLYGLMFDGWSHAGVHYVTLFPVYEEDASGFLVGDNCNTNLSIARKMEIPLVGCASHRFNFAVNKFLAPHETLLSDVNELMVELHKENNFEELQKYTELLPVNRNVTRWSSTFTMVQRYIRIGPEIK
ncbi:hypothetical protein PHMEG_0009474 [Phytophthora megakarya]|uniref:Uncharacterized protein n=1 Tax=Phytophthora megakarya TaxID=4795 RepID=A0A225WHI4_9STRA|nr:hypothetical protein PHMEG_0009474 [Phytophthora megakarya]